MKIIEMIEKRRKILDKYGDSYGNLKCDKCPYVVRAIEPSLAAENKKEYQLRNNQRFFAFKSHQQRHLDCNFECSVCGKKFQTLNFVKQHKSQVHFGKHSCDLCVNRYTTAAQLKQHRLVQHERKATCNICDETINGGLYELAQHNAIKHTAARDGRIVWQCTLCQTTLSGLTRRILVQVKKKHIMEIHNPDEDRFKCDYCDETFRNKTKYQNHTNQHLNATPYKCEQCDKAYTTRAALYQHFKKSVAHREQ